MMKAKLSHVFSDLTNNIVTENIIGNLDKVFEKEIITPADLCSTEIYFTVGGTDYALSKIKSIEIIKNSDEKITLEKKTGSASVYELNAETVSFDKIFEKLENFYLGK